MKLTFFKSILSASICIIISSCGNQQSTSTNTDTTQTAAVDSTKLEPSIKTDSVIYSSNGKQSKGYIAYDENKKGKLPVVIVMPEWWGITSYTKSRARQLAELGYFAMDADPFGKGDTATNPKEAMGFAKPYYTNPQLALTIMNAAISRAAAFPQADTSRLAAIGYCFGGFIVLNAAKLGAPLKATVSFHGGLDGVQPKKDIIKGDILICQGGADQFVPEKVQNAFKKSLDSVGAHYQFVVYPGAMHAFSNPDATALGQKFQMPIAYNAAADTASWKAMQNLFATALK